MFSKLVYLLLYDWGGWILLLLVVALIGDAFALIAAVWGVSWGYFDRCGSRVAEVSSMQAQIAARWV